MGRLWFDMQIQTFTAKKTKGTEVVLIVIPTVSLVGEDALNHWPPRPELSNIKSWILLSYFIFFPGKAVWLCPDMKTYPSVFEMIPKEMVSRHKSTKIRERTKPWHIIVIPEAFVFMCFYSALRASPLRRTILSRKNTFGTQGSRVAEWVDTINVNNLSGKHNLKTKMNWNTIVLMRVDDSSSVLHFLSINGKPQILLETNSIVLFLSSVYHHPKVACICPVVSSYSTMAYPVVLQVWSDFFPDKTIHLLSNF